MREPVKPWSAAHISSIMSRRLDWRQPLTLPSSSNRMSSFAAVREIFKMWF